MPFWYPEEGSDNDPAWWRPVEMIAAPTRQSDNLPTIAACEFMFMGREDRRRRASIWLYKHYLTRNYLNLDDAGHAYRYIPPRDEMSKAPGRYLVHRRLSVALARLQLWLFPVADREDLCRSCEQCEGSLRRERYLTRGLIGGSGGVTSSS